MTLSNRDISGQAAQWAVKLDGAEPEAAQAADFQAWLASDPRALGAFGKACAVLARVERFRGVGAQAFRPARAAPAPLWTRRRLVVAGSSAAGAAVAAGVAAVVFLGAVRQRDYATAIGQLSTIALTDGSIVTLNTDTQILVRFSGKRRDVHLVRGEALFNVAKDKQRPFVVTAANAQVRAVGTSFSVRLLQQRPVTILVQEGIVEISRRDAPKAVPVRATAQTQALVAHAMPIKTHTVPYARLVRDVAWQYGEIALENETLADAAREFSRYGNKQILVAPSVAHHTITGLFPANDPVGFAKAAAAVYGLNVDVAERDVRIIP